MLVDSLLYIIGTEVSGIFEERPKLRESLEKAILDEHIYVILNREGKGIGFFTWKVHGTNVVFENLFILKKHKGEYNFCRLRRLFRERYPGAKFSWRNRKKERILCIA